MIIMGMTKSPPKMMDGIYISKVKSVGQKLRNRFLTPKNENIMTKSAKTIKKGTQ